MESNLRVKPCRQLQPEGESVPKKSSRHANDREARKRLRQLAQEPVKDLLWHYQVGEQVDRICLAENRGYGDGLIEELAENLEIAANTLWTARTFSRVYSRREVRKLSKPSPTGFKMTWGHVVHLVTFKDDVENRLWFEKHCQENEWSTRELRRQIKDFREPKGKGGRKFEHPENVETALRQLIDESQKWDKRFQEVWFRDDEPAIPSHAKEYRTQKARNLVADAVETLKTLESDIAEALKSLEQLNRKLASKKKASRKRKRS